VTGTRTGDARGRGAPQDKDSAKEDQERNPEQKLLRKERMSPEAHEILTTLIGAAALWLGDVVMAHSILLL
jgi:hypothetical protein